MKIAIITSRFPYPIEKGDKLRAYHQIRMLSRKHDIHLFALTHRAIDASAMRELKKHCTHVHVYHIPRWKVPLNTLSAYLAGLPVQIGYFLDQRLKRRLQADVIRAQADHIYVQLIRAAEYVRAIPQAKTLDYMDVFSVGARQRARSSFLFFRPFFNGEAQRLSQYERSIYPDFDNHAIISEQDRDRLPLPYSKPVRVISNGVDTDHFQPMAGEKPRHDVVFAGNLGYGPNVQAARTLVKKVMPMVWKSHPGATVTLVGARPNRGVLALAGTQVEVTGWVDDMRSAYTSGRVFVAPLFTGMGQQNKLLEAMAMGRACVTSPMVNNAIGGRHDHDLCVAENPDEFAKSILTLLSDDQKREVLGANARKLVQDRFTWEVQNELLQELFSVGKSKGLQELVH